MQLTDDIKRELVEKAKGAISNYLTTGKRAVTPVSDENSLLNEKIGAFVSIYVNDQLRGCIGSFDDKLPLNEVIQSAAISAACDSRFDPVQPDELPNAELEISILTPMQKIRNYKEIELGRHGIYIKKGLRKGTFLPQVALKTGWTLEEFLGHCSKDKAGIGWNGWKNASLYVYEAIIFRGR